MLCFWSVGQLLTINTKTKFATFVQVPVGQLLVQLLPPALEPPKVVHDELAPLLREAAKKKTVFFGRSLPNVGGWGG